MTSSVTPSTSGKWFDRIVIAVFENTNFNDALQNKDFSDIVSRGSLLSAYYATTHPSQPNYLAIISGSTHGITSNLDANIQAPTIVDALESKNLTWATYQQAYPGACFDGTSSGLYVRKHNPFISFDSIRLNSTRCANIKSDVDFEAKLAAETSTSFANFIFFTPDMFSSGHDSDLTVAGAFALKLADKFEKIRLLGDRTLFMITFDEAEKKTDTTNNQIATVIWGPEAGVNERSMDSSLLNHYSILNTVIQNWELTGLSTAGISASNVFKLSNNQDVFVAPVALQTGTLSSEAFIGVGLACGIVFIAFLFVLFCLFEKRQGRKTKVSIRQ